MVYYIDYHKSEENNAGNKAPDDVAKICKELDYSEFLVPALPKGLAPLKSRLWIMLNAPIWWDRLKKTVNKDDTIIYQHPMYGARLALKEIKEIKQKKGCRFVVVIHDLESLRNGVEGEYKVNTSTSDIADNQLLRQFDKIICHNEKMMKYLLEKGFEEDKLINLEIFDYLCDLPIQDVKYDPQTELKIIIAGNLNWGKSRYIYEFGEILDKTVGICINAYGNNFDESKASKSICYKGSYRPDELPGVLEGNFGLVWDGISADSCIGNTGEYLKYNNPHKTSLYIASGIPVIVWSQAAISNFINENKIGITINSLQELPEQIRKITREDYVEMKKNTVQIARKLRNGYFTRKALLTAL